MWAAAIPEAAAADGAIETLMMLRDAGIRTGIVSYPDTRVFRGLSSQTGLAGLTNVELCSKRSGSMQIRTRGSFCRPWQLSALPRPTRLFVGDSIEADIIGANRVGMRTALLSGREFNLGTHQTTEPEAQPPHRITKLIEVTKIPLGLSLRPTPISV